MISPFIFFTFIDSPIFNFFDFFIDIPAIRFGSVSLNDKIMKIIVTITVIINNVFIVESDIPNCSKANSIEIIIIEYLIMIGSCISTISSFAFLNMCVISNSFIAFFIMFEIILDAINPNNIIKNAPIRFIDEYAMLLCNRKDF